ncbi:MAG: DUF6931 family protein [Gemmatimonadaceae bacterium]
MTAPAGAPASYATAPPPRRGTADISAVSDLGEKARALLGPSPPAPKEFIGALVAGNLFADAVRFLAHALPRRECVWWAWVCARKAAGAEPPLPIQNALDATERWIMQPTEEHRRAALQFGELADFGTAAGCAALAAFMSGGSLAPPDAPPVPAGEFMTAKAVSGSVTLSAVSDADHADEKFAECINLGLEVADRTKLWGA